MFYTNLAEKHMLSFSAYMECSTTYAEGVYTYWLPITQEEFLKILREQ